MNVAMMSKINEIANMIIWKLSKLSGVMLSAVTLLPDIPTQTAVKPTIADVIAPPNLSIKGRTQSTSASSR